MILSRNLLLDFQCATPATPIAADLLFLNVRSVCRLARPPCSAPVQSQACFICLTLLRSLLLDFPCSTPATPIVTRLFLNVRSVCRLARPPYSTPVPSQAGFIRLTLLRSLLLDFPCTTPATPIAQDLLFFNVRFAFLQVVEESLIERRNEDVSCCQSCEQALLRANGWAPRKMQTMRYAIPYCDDASVLHHPLPGMFPLQEMHSRTLSRLSASVLIDQPDSEGQSEQPVAEPDTRGQSHPNSVLENFFSYW